LLTILIVLAAIGLLLVAMVAALYSYDSLTGLESGGGFLCCWRQPWPYGSPAASGAPERLYPRWSCILIGLVLGLLWAIEIGINNFIAPPLPARDIITSLLGSHRACDPWPLALWRARQTGQPACVPLKPGPGGGFASGLVACLAALAMIVFRHGFITSDPLNLAEWSGRFLGRFAPTMLIICLQSFRWGFWATAWCWESSWEPARPCGRGSREGYIGGSRYARRSRPAGIKGKTDRGRIR